MEGWKYRMRVFLTGATGFIGRYVLKHLEKEGYNILLLTRASKENISSIIKSKKVDIVSGNLSDINKWKDKLIQFKPEVTIHLAWEGIPDYGVKTSIKNLKYGLDLFEELAEIECKKIICTGSCWEYGQNQGKVSEDFPIRPSNAFTAAKNALYWLGREIAKESNVIFIWTRLFYVYGPGQRENSLIPYIIKCVKEGKELKIKIPSARNDFIYVEDVAKAIVAILENCNQSTVYNIGSGYSTSIQDIIKIAYSKLNLQYKPKDKVFKSDNPPFDTFWANISKIKKEIGWEPKLTISDALQRTIYKYKNGKKVKK
jgi:nucleoside-diphosphate-sugar epimerase